MNDGHRTSAITRPRSATSATARPADDGTIFSDLTRPISQDKQLVRGPGKRTIIGISAGAVVLALLAALFVLPVKSYLRQRHDLAERRRELVVLTAANAQLEADVNHAQTPEGIAEAARQEIGYVNAGEMRITLTMPPAASLTLPVGWPYDAVAQIIAVRMQSSALSSPLSPPLSSPTSTAPPPPG